MTPCNSHRLLVFGLDGATFDLLQPWLDDNKLPCLARLCRDGVHGRLRSTTPPLSPEAWATFMTGKDPGHHGVMNFLSLRPGSYQLEFSSGAQLQTFPFWRQLSDDGIRVGIVGVPMTYPPAPVNGFLISGLDTPGGNSEFTYPRELQAELDRAVGGYDIHGEFLDTNDPHAYCDRILRMMRNQSDAVSHLLQRYPVDLSIFVMTATDRIQHYFWRLLNPNHPAHEPDLAHSLADNIHQIYAAADSTIQRIIDQTPDPKTVLIISDHGFGPCHSVVHLNSWLADRGYLTTRANRSGADGIVGRFRRALATAISRSAKDWLKSKMPALRQRLDSYLLLNRIDWARTRAFSLDLQYGYIYINRRDRFPEGAVAAGSEAEALSHRIASDLLDLRDPDSGAPVVREVHETSTLYTGPAATSLPDLIVEWEDGYIARTNTAAPIGEARDDSFIERRPSPARSSTFIPEEWSGCHRPEGILIAHGPDLNAPAKISGSRIIDIAPSILYLLDQPVPKDFGGQVLTEMFRPERLATQPVRFREPTHSQPPPPSVTSSDTDPIERLRDLGYLD